jgi:hypothetical protein
LTADTPPVGSWKASAAALVVRQLLARAGGLARSQQWRNTARIALLLLGLVVQALMLLTAAYLCDLALSLMELWAELARKHLELTM